jgi:peptidoglycan/xylan/chitin deacetylase (PgdA/CDA1 family)
MFKSIIMATGYYTGIFELVRWLHSRQGKVPILVYHRLVHGPILPGIDSSFQLRGLTVSVSNFEKQIAYLKRKYRLISLTDYINCRKSGESLANCAVLTFDDGYKDFLTLAWPVIKKYEVPVTVFFPKSFLNAVHWQHQLYYVLDEATVEKVTVVINQESVVLDLGRDRGKYQAIINLVTAIRKLPAAARLAAVGAVSKTLGVSKQLAPGDFYLSAEDLKLLANSGVELGAHTVSHSNMTELDEQQVDREISESITFIRDLTGRQEIAFALPFSAGDGKVLDKIKKSGCLCSFGRAAGLNTAAEDIFQLKRIAALDFSIAEFAYNVSGAGMK